MSELELTRFLGFGPAIVWDALVDEDLVTGWLAVAHIDLVPGGKFLLEWERGHVPGTTTGVVLTIVPRERLVVATNNLGTLDFSLTLASWDGSRMGTRLRLSIEVDTDPRFLEIPRAQWERNLDQLDELLRGRPTDWESGV